MLVKIKMTVNGKPVAAEVAPRVLLVDFIRDTLRLTGTHIGCDTAQCGACTIHMNGNAVKCCNMLAVQARRRRYRHHRGHSAARRHHAPDAGGVPRPSRPAMRLLHAGHGDERHRSGQAPPETEREPRSAPNWTATCAAALAITASSRPCWPAPPPNRERTRNPSCMNSTTTRLRASRMRRPSSPPQATPSCSPADRP